MAAPTAATKNPIASPNVVTEKTRIPMEARALSLRQPISSRNAEIISDTNLMSRIVRALAIQGVNQMW